MSGQGIDLSKLSEPFPEEDIEWRVARCGVKGEKPWCQVLAYVTNRAIMGRLDDVCGPENWQNEFRDIMAGGVMCGISIKCGSEWVTKWDGSDKTQIEATKGGLSGAMKRAGSQWGIGRYLYKLPQTWAECVLHKSDFHSNRASYKKPDGSYGTIHWATPILPEWAVPERKK